MSSPETLRVAKTSGTAGAYAGRGFDGAELDGSGNCAHRCLRLSLAVAGVAVGAAVSVSPLASVGELMLPVPVPNHHPAANGATAAGSRPEIWWPLVVVALTLPLTSPPPGRRPGR